MALKFLSKENIPKSRKKLALIILGICVLTFVGSEIPRHISYSTTALVGYHVFYYKDHVSPGDIQTGHYVVFPLYTKIVPHCWPCSVVKQVGCDSGQVLKTTTGRDYYCAKKFLGHAKTHSLTGVAVKNFVFNGVVPKGKFFAIGGCKNSYDSRYFGFVDKTNVKARAYPLF
jgi:conjugal transfer pilin signal peptidase TrbI